MNIIPNLAKFIKGKHAKPGYTALDIIKYIGPGLLVTVGFIDPGNWAANISSGAEYGYTLLWVITLSTILLIILQHNVAHLGIATGLCLSEALTTYTKKWVSRSILSSAMLASISTSLAEILGGAIALNMLFHIPISLGAILVVIFVIIMLFSNSYRKTERWIIGFVSIIGLSFIYELALVKIDWSQALVSSFKPSIPQGSIIIIMSIIGSVVMPHNLFLHSEIIQSRQWNLEDEKIINKQLKYEFYDTLISMILGWGINVAMIILAATTFFQNHTGIDDLQQAHHILSPLLGSNAATIFALALLFAGTASTITSAIAGGSIFSGIYNEPFDTKDYHSRIGVSISIIGALIIIFFVTNPLKCLILSQMVLSIQLPFTIFSQIYLTSSKKVMSKYANTRFTTWILYIIAVVVIYFNIRLFIFLLF